MEAEMTFAIVRDQEGYRLANVDSDISTTLIAVASEDPEDWSEVLRCWPRYTSRVVPEFASALTFELVARDDAISAIQESDRWILIDLVEKRYLSGVGTQLIERDACFARHTDDEGKQHDPLSVHFAPWWELQEHLDHSDLELLQRPRESPINIQRPDREILFGEPLIHDLASRMMAIVETQHGRDALASEERADVHSLVVKVHRDWLMTPRDDLGGKHPRQLLHGGVDWIDKLKWGQRLRFERGGQIVALPADFSGVQVGPMGREEMAMYFDLCRELIESGLFWCSQKLVSNSKQNRDDADQERHSIPVGSTEDDLVTFLTTAKTQWMSSPFEGGSPPCFILECSRRRVPRGAGVEIVGMSQRQTEQHIIDCDCPICNMMSDGLMGVGFTSIDGHHLELDNEFAFSMFETLEEWQAEQDEYARFAAKCDREREERERKIATGELDEQDEFASVWSNGFAGGNSIEGDDPIPGDSSGNIKLAFLLAEVVCELQQLQKSRQRASGASTELIKRLNKDFANFRTCERPSRSQATQELSSTLEDVAKQYPLLVSRVADFQSRLAERERSTVNADDNWDQLDFPF